MRHGLANTLGLLALLLAAAAVHAATIIDFNEFPIGTELSVVNAAIPGEFAAPEVPGSTGPDIGPDSITPNDNVLRVPVDQSLGLPDLVFYFPAPVTAVSLGMAGDPDGVFEITAFFYTQPAPIAQLFSLTPTAETSGVEPVGLSYSGRAVRALAVETSGNNLLHLTSISWTVQRSVLEPSTVPLIAPIVGLVALAAVRRAQGRGLRR